MKTDVTLTAEKRAGRGKNEARRARRAGQIPAVVYGAFQDPVAVALDPRALNKIIHSSSGYNTIFNLALDGSTTPVMIADHQNDPIRGTLLHADLKRIDLSKRLRVTVPVLTKGDPKGVKQQGGHFELVTRAIEIECLPDDIPASFIMDVMEMRVGENLRAGEVPLSGSMKLMSSPDTVIAHVVGVRVEAEAAPEAGAAAEPAQPEVVKKGKKEEEGGAEKGGDKGKKK